MAMEVLDESQPWQIHLPSEDGLRDRVLVAKRKDGSVATTWRYEKRFGLWMCSRATHNSAFGGVIHTCAVRGWTLWSLPR